MGREGRHRPRGLRSAWGRLPHAGGEGDRRGQRRCVAIRRGGRRRRRCCAHRWREGRTGKRRHGGVGKQVRLVEAPLQAVRLDLQLTECRGQLRRGERGAGKVGGWRRRRWRLDVPRETGEEGLRRTRGRERRVGREGGGVGRDGWTGEVAGEVGLVVPVPHRGEARRGDRPLRPYNRRRGGRGRTGRRRGRDMAGMGQERREVTRRKATEVRGLEAVERGGGIAPRRVATTSGSSGHHRGLQSVHFVSM